MHIARPWFTCSNSERGLHASFTWWCASLKIGGILKRRGSLAARRRKAFPRCLRRWCRPMRRRLRAREQTDRPLVRAIACFMRPRIILTSSGLLTSSVILDVQTLGMRLSFHLTSFVSCRWIGAIYEKLYCRAIGSKGGRNEMRVILGEEIRDFFFSVKLKLSKNSNTFEGVKLKFMSLSIPDTYFSVFVELDDAHRIARWMRESSYRVSDMTTAVINSDLMKAEGVRKKILDYWEKLGPRDSASGGQNLCKCGPNRECGIAYWHVFEGTS